MAIDPKTGTGEVNGYYIGPGADLTGANLNYLGPIGSLDKANLEGAILRDAQLADTFLRGANLRGADLTGANLKGAQLRGADLTGAIINNAEMAAIGLEGAILDGATIADSRFYLLGNEPANLTNASLRGAEIARVNFSNACLTGADFTSAKIEIPMFFETRLHEVCFEGAEIINPFFINCAITRCNFNGATLSSTYTKEYLSNWKTDISHFVASIIWDSTFIDTAFQQIKFNEVNFYKSTIQNTLFTESIINFGYFELCEVNNLEFNSCDHDSVNFHNSMDNLRIINSTLNYGNFINSDFRGLVIEGSKLICTRIGFCDFKNATLKGSSFYNVDFFGSLLDGSDLSGASIKASRLAGASFRGVTFKDGKIIGACRDLASRTINNPSTVGKDKSGFVGIDNLVRDYFGDGADERPNHDELNRFVTAGILRSSYPWTREAHVNNVDKGDPESRENEEYEKAAKSLLELCPESEQILDERFLHYREERNRRERAWLNTTVGKSRGLYHMCVKDKRKKLTSIDFTGSNLDGIKFIGTSISAGLSLIDCSMVGATMRNCILAYSNFTRADLRGAKLFGSYFLEGVFKDADLEKCSLVGAEFFTADFDGANFKNVKFLGSKFLSNSNLSRAKNLNENSMARCFIGGAILPPGFKQPTHVKIKGMSIGPAASFPGANLRGADLSGLSLKNADFEGADLSEADFLYSDIENSNFSGANLEGSRFFSAHIEKSNFSDAKLMRARFGGEASNQIKKSNLSGADLSGAKLEYTNIIESNLKNANLSETKSKNLSISRSDMSELAAENTIMRSPIFRRSDLTGADFSGSAMEVPRFIKDKLKNTSFENTKLKTPIFENNRYDKTSFRGAEFEYPIFEGRSLGTANFTGSKIKEPSFDNSIDARKATFKDAEIKFPLDSEDRVKFMTPNLMSRDMREVLKDDIDRNTQARTKAIKSDKRYLGDRTGLWIHQTHEPKTAYYGELCVSPYEQGEPIFERRGIYGVVFDGTAPLFSIDVWSTKNKYGMLMPGETPPSWTEPFKEGFLDAQLSKIVQLNVLKGFEDPSVIKKFKDKRIPVKVVQGSEELLKQFGKIVRPSEKQLEKARGLIEVLLREPNPSCRVCGQHASLVSRSGAPICEDCY